ncbi:MAG: aminoglycoside phosphotransferase family protein [Pseudolysinimonas sp.]|uniref:aminoglycoside phosphotransferase family protein n=1 Tax=Pseudolysinimonas sp. TaxID=2680009 RepID=UPI00326489C3
MKRPPSDIRSDAALVAALVAEQHPSFAGPVDLVAGGWDNVIYRLGSGFAARLPRREVAVPLIENEQRWLPTLTTVLPVIIPSPLAVGRPTARFPWPWSIVAWIDGSGLDEVPPPVRDAAADTTADALLALHRRAPGGAPVNRVRGVPLADRLEAWRGNLAATDLDGDDLGMVEAAFAAGATAAIWDGDPVWVHGDLHPANTVVDPVRGDLVALLDFGDLCSGDPATDLALAWTGFGPEGRAQLRERLDANGSYDDAVWVRARAWAAGLAVTYLAHADDAPRMGAIARHTFTQLHRG